MHEGLVQAIATSGPFGCPDSISLPEKFSLRPTPKADLWKSYTAGHPILRKAMPWLFTDCGDGQYNRPMPLLLPATKGLPINSRGSHDPRYAHGSAATPEGLPNVLQGSLVPGRFGAGATPSELGRSLGMVPGVCFAAPSAIDGEPLRGSPRVPPNEIRHPMKLYCRSSYSAKSNAVAFHRLW